jgi:hypothetical protein
VAALREATDPTQRQDYKFILLSSFSVKETRRFSESLFDSVAMSHKVQQNSNEVLGASLVDEISTVGDASSRYKTRGSYQKKFKSLFEKDVSFKLYATSKGINIEDLSIGEENERAALIRKIIWPVFIREEFLFAPDFGALRKSSRRIRTAHQISDIYTGAASLFAICEGNPRQIIGLMGPILRAYGADQLASSRPVRRSLQKQLVQKMISAYFALVSTVPIGDQLSQARSLVDVISLIGNYFKDTVLGEEFDPDPVASFVIDAGVPPPIMEMVGKGINIGAFIVEDVTKSNTPYTLGEIVGLKARLSNIFAPHFRLPLAGGRTINLSTILSRDSKRSQPLLELFGLKI